MISILEEKVEEKTSSFHRQHKTAIHIATIVVILISLVYEGAKTADWAFLGLSILCELG